MDEETQMALSQDNAQFFKFEHVKEINRVIKRRYNKMVRGLFWDLRCAHSSLRSANEVANGRFNLFRRWDRKYALKCKQEFEEVVDKLTSLGYTAKELGIE